MSKPKKNQNSAADTPPESVVITSRSVIKDPEPLAEAEVKEPMLTAPILPIETLSENKKSSSANDKKASKPAKKAAEPAQTKPAESSSAEEDTAQIIPVKRLSIQPLAETNPADPPEAPAPDPVPESEAEQEPEPEVVADKLTPKAKQDSKPQVQPLKDEPTAAVQEDPKPEPGSEPEPQAETPEPEAEDVGESQNKPEASTEDVSKVKAEHEAAVQKLAESKKYFLPINAVEKRRSKHFVIAGLLLSLILLAAWVNVALDAGLIEIPGVKPVTHFFSN